MAGAVCDSNVRRLILDEAIDATPVLPVGVCQGTTVIPKSWNQLAGNTIQCTLTPGTPIGADADGDEDANGSVDGDEQERGTDGKRNCKASESGVARNSMTLLLIVAMSVGPSFLL